MDWITRSDKPMCYQPITLRVLVTEYDSPLSTYPLGPDQPKSIRVMSCQVPLVDWWIQLSTAQNGCFFINQLCVSNHLRQNRANYGITAPSFSVRNYDQQSFDQEQLYDIKQEIRKSPLNPAGIYCLM